MSSPSRAAASPGWRCPYPGCKNSLDGAARVCACEYKLPVARCAVCSNWNRAHAILCRACRSELQRAKLENGLTASPVEFIEAPGDYYYPPAFQSGLLWCLGADGKLARVSPRGGAKPLAVAELPSRMAGMNRVLAVSAMQAAPPFRGPLLIACDKTAIYGVSLLTGESGVLQRPSAKAEIVANAVAEESIYFRGMAATPEMICFLQRAPGAREAKLAVRYFHPQRAAEDPLNIPGSEFLTPVIAGDRIAVSSDEEVGVYNLRDQSRSAFSLPRNFRPFFARTWQINVPQGSVPLTLGVTVDGLEVWIAGSQDDRQAGILRIGMDRQSAEFMPLPKGAAIADAFPSGWCVNQVDSAGFFGIDRPAVRIGALQPGMPMACTAPRLAYFSRNDKPGSHRLTYMAGESLDLKFDDFLCNEDSCCGIILCGAEIVVSYLSRGSPASRGLKFAHWNLTA